MITIQDIAKNIESKLQAVVTEDMTIAPYTFKIEPISGDISGDRKIIHGTIVPYPGNIVPVEGLNSFYLTYRVVLTPYAELKEDIFQYVSSYIESTNGQTNSLQEYAYIMSFSAPEAGATTMVEKVGRVTPISFMVYYQFIKNGVLSNDCKWKLNDTVLKMLDGSAARASVLSKDTLCNNNRQESALLVTGHAFQFNLPYLKEGIYAQLVEDILSRSKTTYTLEYEDSNLPSKKLTWLVVLESGQINYQAGKVPFISCVFTLARTDIYGG